jgi:hypothetical protein
MSHFENDFRHWVPAYGHGARKRLIPLIWGLAPPCVFYLDQVHARELRDPITGQTVQSPIGSGRFTVPRYNPEISDSATEGDESETIDGIK